MGSPFKVSTINVIRQIDTAILKILEHQKFLLQIMKILEIAQNILKT